MPPEQHRFLFILIIILSLCFPSICHAESTKPPLLIRVGAYENRPKVYSDENGDFIGLFPDILNYIAAKEGWRLQYISGTWTECLERLENNEIDVMLDVAYSEEREKQYDLSKETVFVNWAKIYTRQNVDIESILDLQNQTVAVMKNSIHTTGTGGIRELTDQFGITCTFVEVTNYIDVFELLDEGKADAGVVNRIFGSLFEYYYNVNKTPIVFNPRDLKFAFPKQGKLTNYLIEKIDANLHQLKNDHDSIFYKIIEVNIFGFPRKWLHSDVSRERITQIPLTDKEQEWIRAHPVIRIGIDPEFFPFEFIDQQGTYCGITSDYISLLNKRLGLNMQLAEKSSWKTAVEKIKDKDIDVLPCIGITDVRKSFLKYSKPYIFFHRVIITRIDTPFIAGIDDLHDFKVTVQANSSHEGYLRDHTSISPITCKTLEDALLAVANGKADAFIGNLASSTYWIHKMKLTNLKVAAPVSNKLETLHFGIRTDWPELVRIINKGFTSITPEEKIEIERRWVSIEYTPGINPKTVWKYTLNTSIIVIIIFCAFVFWNYMLKQEIAARKKAQDELKEYQKNLEWMVTERTKRIEEVNRSLAQAQKIAHLGNWDWDITVDKFYWTDELYRIFGVNPEEIEASFDTFIRLVHPDDRQHVTTCLKNALQNGAAFSIEHRIVRPDTSMRIVHELVEVFVDKNGKPARIMGAVQDITIRKQYEEEREHLIQDLESKQTEVEQFTYTISHELKTPLITIEGFLRLLKKELYTDNKEQSEDYIRRVIVAAQKMHQMLNELLELLKIGRYVIPEEKVQFYDVVQEALHRLEEKLKSNTIKITIQNDLPLIRCDRKRLIEVITNLLDNAVKFMGDTPDPHISIGTIADDHDVTFYIKDNGIGIEQNYHQKIFTMFNKLSATTEGTGIGLALTKRIIEQHNGRIWIESEGTGQGTSVYFSIPK